MIFEERTKKVNWARFDRRYSSIKDYNADLAVQYPKFEGKWCLALLEPTVDEINSLPKEPPFIELHVFLKKDVLKEFVKPDNSRTAYQEFLENYVSVFQGFLEPKVPYQIYSRCRGDASRISEVMDQLKNYQRVSVRTLDSFLPKVDVVFASDVVKSILCYKNSHVSLPSLLRFKRVEPVKTASTLISILGSQYAFFTVRKYIRALMQQKLDYLNKVDLSKIPKQNLDLLQQFDFYTIMYLYTLFEKSTEDSFLSLVILASMRQRQIGTEVLETINLYK